MGGEDGEHLELLESAEKKTDPCQPFVEVSDHHGRRAGEPGDKLEIGMDGRREREGKRGEGKRGEGEGGGRNEVRIFATQVEAS